MLTIEEYFKKRKYMPSGTVLYITEPIEENIIENVYVLSIVDTSKKLNFINISNVNDEKIGEIWTWKIKVENIDKITKKEIELFTKPFYPVVDFLIVENPKTKVSEGYFKDKNKPQISRFEMMDLK